MIEHSFLLKASRNMDKAAFAEFIKSIPSIEKTQGGTFHDDLVGLIVERTTQSYNAFWTSFPGAHRRMRKAFEDRLGSNWEDCYEEYQRKSKGLHIKS